jgi:hypothetical protein
LHSDAPLVRARELQELTVGTVASLEDIFNDLAEAIVRLGHGAMLLVTKVPSTTPFSSLRRIDGLFFQQLLIQYWNSVAALTRRAGGVGNVLARAEAGVVHPDGRAVASVTAMLANGSAAIANLAGGDGAIVLDYACHVTAFNAIIDRSLSLHASCRLVDQDGLERPRHAILRNRCSRHHAALSYAMQVPHSFAFVIFPGRRHSAFGFS